MLDPPLTPELTRFVAPPPEFEWDEWKFQSYFYYAITDELDALRTLTPNANRAYAIAVCEWVEHRFSAFNDDPMPLSYIASGWAALLNRACSQHIRLDDRAWKGPVRGPLMAAFGIVNEIFYESGDDPDMALRACYALNLARHVLPDGSGFEAWSDIVRERLFRHHLVSEDPDMAVDIFADDFPSGRLVPRSAFDSSRPYAPGGAFAELFEFARRQEGEGNPFVNLEPLT